MIFSFDRKEFIDALLVGGSMAGKSKLLPILDCVKINVRGEKSSISSYNGEVAVSKRVNINSTEECALCVNKQDIDGFIRSVSDATISIEYDGSSIEIKHKKGVMSLPTFPVEEFAQPKIEKEGNAIKVDSSSLLSVITDASKFRMVKDELRPVMTCINMTANCNLLEVYASDNKSLYGSSIPLEEGSSNFMLNLTDTAIAPLKFMLERCDEVTIISCSSTFTVKSEDSFLSALKREGRYPNAKSVIPTYDTCSRMQVGTKELLEAVKRCAMTADKATAVVTISCKQPTFIEICSKDMDFNRSTTEYIDCQLEGDLSEFTVKYDCLLNVLSCIMSDTITLIVESNTQPVIVEDELAKNNTYLLMPFLPF